MVICQTFGRKGNAVQSEPTATEKNRKKLILAITLLAILIVGVGYAFIRSYFSTNLTISTTPISSQTGMTVDVRGRLTDGFGVGLVGYNVSVESSSDGGHWSDLAGPFLTQSPSGSGQQAGTWYVHGGWNFSSTLFLRAVFSGYGSYAPSNSPTLQEIVRALSLSQYWGTFYY